MKGYYSMGLAGFDVEVLDDETVAYTYVYPGASGERPHKAKVKYSASGRAYFTSFMRRRVYLDECLRF